MKSWKWTIGPLVWFLGVAALLVTWKVMDPATLVANFDRDGYSPFELATIPVFAAIVPLVWCCCPFSGSRKRKTILCLAVSLVAVMAIVKELDLHNMAMHALWPNVIGEDGSVIAHTFKKPNGAWLTGTPFKMRFLTNGAVPFGAKAFVMAYFALFFGTFATLFAYYLPAFVRGVFKLDPVAWAFGCFGGSGVLVQISDRLPSWLGHAHGLEKSADGVTSAQSLCTVLEEGGEMLLAFFALLTIFLGWRKAKELAALPKYKGIRRVLFWGRFDHGYSKTRVNIAMFKALGWEVEFFDVKWCCRFGDFEAFLRGLDERPLPDLVFVPICRQRDIAAACRWAHRRGIKVLFDPMISAWDKKVLEQKKWKAEEPRAKRLLAWEKKLMAMPDFITWDTSCHVDFAAEYLDVPREKMAPLFTGTDENVFKSVATNPNTQTPDTPNTVFRVLYHGAYLPLHGTEVIVEAARMTQDLPIQWDFLGWGAYKAATEEKAAGLKNVRFLDKVPYEKVAEVICDHDIVLGVFGTTAKAARVIGNKVYECMACARPTINEFCTGYPPSAADCKAIKFIPAGDPAALVKAVEEYRADWANKEMYFKEARAFFDRELSMSVVKSQLQSILARMGF